MNASSLEPRYTLPAVLLHWLLAVLILTMIGLGYYMTELPRNTPERAFFVNLHKSLGLLTAGLVVIRICWRGSHPPPPLPASVPSWQQRASVVSHRLLYVFMLLQPITGYLTSSFGKYGIAFFGLPLPNWGWDDPQLREIAVGAHRTIVIILMALIVVHVLAALKHLLVDRDHVFARMLPIGRRVR
jgi:cytochrome b561